jgi:hypothetical protein
MDHGRDVMDHGGWDLTPGAGRAQMFQIASGYPWPAALPVMDEDGDINGTTCLFFCTFTVIVIWVRPGLVRGDSAGSRPAGSARCSRRIESGPHMLDGSRP